MHNLIKAGISSLGIIGVGGSLFSGAYFSSNSTIGEVLKDSVFRGDLEDENDWKILQNKLKKSWESEQSPYKDLLKEIKDQETGIKEWCNEKYQSKINTLIPKSESTGIRKLAEKYCTLNVQDKIGEENLFDTNESDANNEFDGQRAQLLKLANDAEASIRKIEDPKFLEYINKNPENKWKGARNWCLEKYKTPYRGKEDEEMWKEVSENCKKIPDYLKTREESEDGHVSS